MSSPALVEMYRELESLGDMWQSRLSARSQEMFYILLGMQPEGYEVTEMLSVSLISGKYISNIYRSAVTGRR